MNNKAPANLKELNKMRDKWIKEFGYDQLVKDHKTSTKHLTDLDLIEIDSKIKDLQDECSG